MELMHQRKFPADCRRPTHLRERGETRNVRGDLGGGCGGDQLENEEGESLFLRLKPISWEKKEAKLSILRLY